MKITDTLFEFFFTDLYSVKKMKSIEVYLNIWKIVFSGKNIDSVLYVYRLYEKFDELLKKCSYVAISSYRRKVLETLKNDVKIPTKISEESGVGIKHVSNVLTDLKEHNLIVCINEDAHKGRLYRLTDEGKNVVSMIGEMGW